MKQLTLRHKVFAGFGLVLGSVGIIGVVCGGAFARVRDTAEFYRRDNLPGLYRANQAKAGALLSYIRALQAASTTSPSTRGRAEAAILEVRRSNDQNLAAYEKTITFTGDRRLYQILLDARARWDQCRRQAVALGDQGKTAEARRLLEGEGKGRVDSYLAAADALIDYNRRNGEGAWRLLEAGVSSLSLVLRDGILRTLALGVAAALFIRRSVTRPVGLLLEQYRGRDEIGQLAASLDRLTTDLRSARAAELEAITFACPTGGALVRGA
jgi:HAMP domain-containing protein